MTKRKFLLAALIAVTVAAIAAAAALFGGCAAKDDGDHVFFKPEGVASKVYVIKEDKMSRAEREMIVSLQGIVAQKRATIFIEDLDSANENGNTKLWLDDFAEKQNVEVVYVNNAWKMLSMFAGEITDMKYVLYSSPYSSGEVYDLSINHAATIAAVEKYVMVDTSIELLAKSRGFVLGDDAREYTTRSVFEKYKGALNRSYLVHQSPDRSELRDYAIAGKALCYYSDYDTDLSINQEILSWADDNAPVFGWTTSETNFVAANSLRSKITVPADWSTNLSFFSAAKQEGEAEQVNFTQEKITPEAGKHYVAIVMSDGDNVQWIQRNFITNRSFFGSPYRGDFKMTWGISPSLSDIAPTIMQKVYSEATAKDQFISGPGGLGYVNISDYNEDKLSEYAAMTAEYMKRGDLEYVNFIDSFVNESALASFGGQEQIKGGIWSVGNKYIEGAGSVYWAGDKPFITARETLWRANGSADNDYYGYTERVAQRINAYKRDYTTIEGYTVVVAHAWSIGTMDCIARFVDKLDSHVQLVTVGEMIEMVKENVKHRDVYALDDVAKEGIQLCAIDSDQLIWKDIKDKQATETRTFNFNNLVDFGGFETGHGSNEYDAAAWVAEHNNCIKLDGSDMGDGLDPMPNSWMYNMFEFGEGDDLLTINMYAGDKADTNVRIRAIYEDGDGNVVKLNLADGFGGEGSLDQFGYFLITEDNDGEFTFDISSLKGKRVIITIEQDDNGEGSGELVYVDSIKITAAQGDE